MLKVKQIITDDVIQPEKPSGDKSVRFSYPKQTPFTFNPTKIPIYLLSEATIARMSTKDKRAYLQLLQEKESRIAELIFPLSPRNKLSI